MATLVLVASIFAPGLALAQDAGAAPPAFAEPAYEGSPLLDLVVMLLGFCLVVGLAWFGIRFLSRRLYGPGATTGGRVRVLERVPLEPHRTLYLVEAGAKMLLIGATDHELRVLGEFNSADLPPPASPERRSFLDALRRPGVGASG